MKRFIAGDDRQQITLLPDCLDDYITADNPVRLVEVFVDELDLTALGFAGAVPEATGRPAYHPATLLKIYLYGYLNRVPSSRRLERESQRNIELIWLSESTVTIPAADYRRLLLAAENDDTIVWCQTCRAWLDLDEAASTNDFTGCWKVAIEDGDESTCRSYRAIVLEGLPLPGAGLGLAKDGD